jgi:hypothetical protein
LQRLVQRERKALDSPKTKRVKRMVRKNQRGESAFVLT